MYSIDKFFNIYLPFCSAASCNRLCSCTIVVTVRAEIEDKMSPPMAPKAGVNGHAYFRVHLLNLRVSLEYSLAKVDPSQGQWE